MTTPALTPARIDAGAQLLLRLEYQRLAREGRILPLRDVGFRNYSQADDDGILWYLLAVVGETSRFCVELGAGDGAECNTANLIAAHDWLHLLVDGDPDNVARGRQLFSNSSLHNLLPPRFEHRWITRDDIDTYLADQALPDVDVLSIDLDGMDYWIWQAITCIRPRIVVIEFNAIWGAAASVTIPYRDHFRAPWALVPDDVRTPGGPDKVPYCGASLPALSALGASKGYRLVGTNGLTYNAFFLRDDVGVDQFPAVQPAAMLDRSGADLLYQAPYRRFYLELAPADWTWQEV